MVFVLTQLPLQALLRKSNYTRRVAKWGTILGVFDIRYLPWVARKGQVLLNLAAEFIEGVEKGGTEEGDMLDKGVIVVAMSPLSYW